MRKSPAPYAWPQARGYFRARNSVSGFRRFCAGRTFAFVVFVELRGEVLNQRLNVFGPTAKCWNLDFDHVDSINQILSETTLLGQCVQVPVPPFPKRSILEIGRLYLFRSVGDSNRRHNIRQIKACHANPVVGHSVVDIEAVR
jgi:hypothetical protein